jgi:membrane-bound serine protease (ClpP class)
MDPLIWSVILTLLMVVVIVLEMLTPSMGLLTVLAMGLFGGSVVTAFASSQMSGFLMAGFNTALFPVTFFLAARLLRKSPLANDQIIRAGPVEEDEGGGALAPTVEVGREGRALTPLRPSGTVNFGEFRLDVVTEGKFVETGTAVKVIRLDGQIVVVEPLGHP